MEDLVKSLEGSFQVSNVPNNTACPHPRFSQYKQKTTNSDQESRRKQLLEKQKSNRLDYMNLVRKLTNEDWDDDDEGGEKDEVEETMDVEVSLRKPGRYYKDQLMLSEWLVEVPGDFKTEWLTVLCPVAKRCLVVASRGQTKAYSKSGYCLNRFPSELPGGHRRTRQKGGTILDCLYCEASRTYYVLDLMCWNGHPVYDSETEFRFYWLHEKCQESPEVLQFSKYNPYIFVPLPSFVCEEPFLGGALEAAKFEIDGLLFFHKRSHYTFGSTPLVVWLKPYMVPEILGIEVPSHQMQGIPSGYTNYANHMKQVEEDRKKYEKMKEERRANPVTNTRRKKKNIRKTDNKEMEVANEGCEDEGEDLEESSVDTETVETNQVPM